MIELVKIFAGNIFKYDWIIIVAILIDVLFLIKTKKHLTIIKSELYPRYDLATTKPGEEYEPPKLDGDAVRKLSGMLDKLNSNHSLFTGIASIFPFLGILGTVYTLLRTTSDSSFDITQANFFVALTSTGWGVLSSIVFKTVDAYISPSVEKYNEEIKAKKAAYVTDADVPAGVPAGDAAEEKTDI